MNTELDNTLGDDELDARLRTTFATVMPLLDTPSTATTSSGGSEADTDGELLVFDLAATPSPPSRRRMTGILGAAAAIVLVVAGLSVAQRDPSPAPAASEPSQLPPPAESTPGSEVVEYEIAPPVGTYPVVSCEENNTGPCNPYADLPVAAGLSDFYVGPERLGTPVVSLDEFGRLVRCTTLDATGATCDKLEGYAGVGITRYLSDVTVDTSSGADAGGLDVEIGTTFTDIAPIDYARAWGNDPELGDASIEGVEVRGHAAVTYAYAGSRYVVWTERPGVLVWVKAANDAPDDLLEIAEGVRRVPGPATIPWIVSVPDEKHGNVYDASSNDADTLLVGRHSDGSECVGLGYIESACTGAIGEQTFVKIVDDRALVTGIAPATVTAVRVSQNGTTLVETPTRPIDASPNLLFSEYVEVEGPVTVEWIDPTGVMASTDIEIDFCRTACG
jgi:hypothetical protein